MTDTRTAKASCIGQGGYSDIHNGTQVVVTDADGRTLALGRLTGAEVGGGLDVCAYTIRIGDVPGGHDFYGIEVSHRGRVQYSRSDVEKPLHLTLG